jgi:hypothetical protein
MLFIFILQFKLTFCMLQTCIQAYVLCVNFFTLRDVSLCYGRDKTRIIVKWSEMKFLTGIVTFIILVCKVILNMEGTLFHVSEFVGFCILLGVYVRTEVEQDIYKE